MSEASYALRRTNPRFSFCADAEITLRDGTCLPGQLSEISARGCYVDALELVPVGTELDLSICDAASSCALHGKVIYGHSGGGIGVAGMGVLFEEMDPEQHSTIDSWIRDLSSGRMPSLGKSQDAPTQRPS